MAKKRIVYRSSQNSLLLPVLVALIVGFAVGFFVARLKYKAQLMVANDMVMKREELMKQLKSKATDRIVKLEGKLMLIKSGIVSMLPSDLMMTDGTTVTKNGEVIRKDGKSEMLNEGESIDMEGNITRESERVEF